MTEATPESQRGVLLPPEPALPDIVDHGRERFLDVVAAHPESSLVWALLAEGALSQATRDGDVSAYAFARTGYHRGVDALRQAGWRGFEPIPWNHVPNQGFLRAAWLLALAARRLGEDAEAERCADLVRDCSPEAFVVLSASRPLDEPGVEAEPEDEPAREQNPPADQDPNDPSSGSGIDAEDGERIEVSEAGEQAPAASEEDEAEPDPGTEPAAESDTEHGTGRPLE